MIVHGRVTFWRIAAASFSAAFGSRYSLRNFTEFLFHRAQLLQRSENGFGCCCVDRAEGKSAGDQHVLADFSLGRGPAIPFFARAAESDGPNAESDLASLDGFHYPP